MKRRLRTIVDQWVELFARHELLNYATAIAFRAFIAFFALLLLGLALLGATGHASVWRNQIGPQVEKKLTAGAFVGVDDAAERILTSGTTSLIVFASLLVIWEVSSSVRASMGALNRIYEADDTRPWWIRFPLSFAIAAGVAVALFGSFVLAVVARHVGHGAVHWLFAVARWLVVVVLLWGATTLIVRFAPAQRRAKRWVTAGAALIVVAWIVTSLAFGFFVSRIANFRSAEGNLAVLFVLASYLYTGATVFLIGVELDELAQAKSPRKRSR
jgi:membrane protein